MITAIVHRHFLQIWIIVFFSFIAISGSIKCFQCNSAEHSGCLDLTVNDTKSKYYKDCAGDYNGQEPFCRKIYTEILDVYDSTRIIRSCGWIQKYITTEHVTNDTKKKDLCRKDDTDFIKKQQCQCFSDACNASNRFNSFTIPLVVTTLLFVCRELVVI